MSIKPRARRGAAAVEFALTFPLLLTMTFGIVEYGWLFHEYNQVHTAMRDAARYAAKGNSGDIAGATTAATARLTENFNFYNVCTSCSPNIGAGTPTDTVTIAIDMPYTPITGFAVPGIPPAVRAEITFALEP